MADKTQKTIRIKWVRSGIGFTRHQKAIVRSLGLGKLNQVVVRPDTPQIRGIVASVPHLLEIVAHTPEPAWASIPEYTVRPPEVAPVPPAAEAAEAESPAETFAPKASESEEATVTPAAGPVAEQPQQPAETAQPVECTGDEGHGPEATTAEAKGQSEG